MLSPPWPHVLFMRAGFRYNNNSPMSCQSPMQLPIQKATPSDPLRPCGNHVQSRGVPCNLHSPCNLLDSLRSPASPERESARPAAPQTRRKHGSQVPPAAVVRPESSRRPRSQGQGCAESSRDHLAPNKRCFRARSGARHRNERRAHSRPQSRSKLHACLQRMSIAAAPGRCRGRRRRPGT